MMSYPQFTFAARRERSQGPWTAKRRTAQTHAPHGAVLRKSAFLVPLTELGETKGACAGTNAAFRIPVYQVERSDERGLLTPRGWPDRRGLLASGSRRSRA